MKKEDIIKIIASEFNVSEIEVMNYFDDIFDMLIECFRKNKNVNISEFGKFFLRIRLNTEGVKEKTVKFSPVKKLADDVNYNFNNLTKVRLRTLEERALDDIVKLQEADINLPEDLVIPETIEEPEEIVIEKETPSKEQVEPVSDTKEGIHVEEIETDSGDIKESIEDIRVEKKAKEEEDKGFDVDTEMRSFLLEHIGYTKRKEEKLEEDKQAAEIIEEEKLEEKYKALSKDKFKEELDKITAEREKIVAEIDEFHLEKKEIEKEEEQIISTESDKILEKEEPLTTEKTEPEKEEEQIISTESDKILEKEEPLPIEKTEPEKEEEQLISTESDKILEKEEPLTIEKTELEKEEEQLISTELDKILEKKEPLTIEQTELEKEEEQLISTELDKILEKEEPLLTEQTELEKEEEQLISTELDKILEKEEPLLTEQTELEKEEEKTEPEEEKDQPLPKELDKITDADKYQPELKIKKDLDETVIEETESKEEEKQPAPQELDKVSDVDLSQRTEEVKREIEEIFAERNRILSEIVDLDLDKPRIEDEAVSKKQEEIESTKEEVFEESIPEKDESDKQKDIEESISEKDEISKMIEERKRILSEIVELDVDKPGTEEKPGLKQQEKIELEDITEQEEEAVEEIKSTKEEVFEESIPDKDESDERKDTEESVSEKDETIKMIEERKRILEKIESYKTEEFKKSSGGHGAEEPQCIDNEEHETKVEIKKDDIVKENKAETISVETVVKSEEPVADHDEVFEKESGELRTEFTNEIETIRSSILYSKNIEEDIDKILNERRKILDNISDAELNVFDKLMEDNDKEEDDSDINKEIESLSKMKMDLGKTEFNQVAENTVVSQVPIADVVETNVEFEISSDVKQLHEEIVREDSSIKEEGNMRIEDTEPKNFDDIFMQDEKKIFTKKSEEEKPKNTQENFDDVFK